MTTWATLLAGLSVWIATKLEPPSSQAVAWFDAHGLPSSWVQPTIKYVGSTAFLAILFKVGEWVVRTELWKWRHPHLDLSGEWRAITTYENYSVNEGEPSDRNKYGRDDYPHRATIEQNCMAIAVAVTTGERFSWHSLAVSLTEQKDPDTIALKYAYLVKYNQGGSMDVLKSVKGFEEMTMVEQSPAKIAQRIPSLLRRIFPMKTAIVLHGTFSHCAEGQTPAYRGRTYFMRANYLSEITEASLPAFAAGCLKQWKAEAGHSK